MTILFVLVPVALLIVLGAVAAFVWAARRGQFDDLTTPALRLLRDEPVRPCDRVDQPEAPSRGGPPGR